MGANPLIGVLYHWIGGAGLGQQLHPIPAHQALVVGDLLDRAGLRRVDRCSRRSWISVRARPLVHLASGAIRNHVAFVLLGSDVGRGRPYLRACHPLSRHRAGLRDRAGLLHRIRHTDAAHLQWPDVRHRAPARRPGNPAGRLRLPAGDCGERARRLLQGEGGLC